MNDVGDAIQAGAGSRLRDFGCRSVPRALITPTDPCASQKVVLAESFCVPGLGALGEDEVTGLA